MKKKDLEDYSQAWNNHDIKTIMKFMTEDCIFETGGGAERYGTRYSGAEEVKARFIETWTDIPDLHFQNGKHFVDGDRGCSEWTLTGTGKDGSSIEVDGCDLFSFENNKIKLKASYLKNRLRS